VILTRYWWCSSRISRREKTRREKSRLFYLEINGVYTGATERGKAVLLLGRELQDAGGRRSQRGPAAGPLFGYPTTSRTETGAPSVPKGFKSSLSVRPAGRRPPLDRDNRASQWGCRVIPEMEMAHRSER
jgi:hypothetical protein